MFQMSDLKERSLRIGRGGEIVSQPSKLGVA